MTVSEQTRKALNIFMGQMLHSVEQQSQELGDRWWMEPEYGDLMDFLTTIGESLQLITRAAVNQESPLSILENCALLGTTAFHFADRYAALYPQVMINGQTNESGTDQSGADESAEDEGTNARDDDRGGEIEEVPRLP